MRTVGLKVLKNKLSDYLRRQGEPAPLASYGNRLLATARALGIPIAAV